MREKRWIAVLVLCMAGALCFGVAGKSHYQNVGLYDIQNVEDLMALNCFQAGMIGYNKENPQMVEEKTYEGFWENREGYTETMMGAPVIVRVHPTERIFVAGDSVGQEFLVEEVIRGEGTIQAEEKYFVYASGAFRIEDEKIYSEMSVNLMFEGKEYLLFLQPSDLNPYQDKQEFWWYDIPLFSCICLEDSVRSFMVPDLERPYEELQEYAFFVYSDRIAEVIGSIRGRLVALSKEL